MSLTYSCIATHRYADSGFITFIGLTVGWELRVKGNLTRRSDNGLINTSPVSSMLPIIHLQSGCEHIIRIPGIILLMLQARVLYGGTCLKRSPLGQISVAALERWLQYAKHRGCGL